MSTWPGPRKRAIDFLNARVGPTTPLQMLLDRAPALKGQSGLPVPSSTGLTMGSDYEGIGGVFGSLDDFASTVKFINPSNGPLHVGLAITEEKGLDDAEKLQVTDPADLLKSKGPLTVTIAYASDSNKQALIALLVAHRVATILKISGKDFKSRTPLASDTMHSSLRPTVCVCMA